MTLHLEKLSPVGFVVLAVAWILVCSILIVTGGELLAVFGGEDCEDHCGETCHDCSDCVLCLPSLHMIVWNGFDFGQVDSASGWTVNSLLVRIVPHPSEDIDHPPQNLL